MAADFGTRLFSVKPREAYTFLSDGPTLIVQGPDGSDTLLNVEKVYFADGTVSIDALTE